MDRLNGNMMIGLALIVAGIVGLALGDFSFVKETHQAQIGPLSVTVKDQSTFTVPAWMGVGSIVLGGGLLFLGWKK